MVHLREESSPPLEMLKSHNNVGLRSNTSLMSLDLNLSFCINLLCGFGQVTQLL